MTFLRVSVYFFAYSELRPRIRRAVNNRGFQKDLEKRGGARRAGQLHDIDHFAAQGLIHALAGNSRGRGRGRGQLRLKNENEVRGGDFEENLVLDRSFLLPLNRSEAPNRTRPRARSRRILLRSENIKDREPSAALPIPTRPHRKCKPQEQRISTTS